MEPLFNFQGSPAVVSVLAFLATGALVAALVAVAAYLFWRGSRFPARRVLTAGGIVLAGYGAALAAFSATSRAAVAEPGQEKYFCEIDCHLAYSIVGARRAPEIGGTRAEGVFQLVTLRTRFDEETTGARRGGSLLYPNPRTVRLVDASGRSYAPSQAGTEALGRAAGPQTPLSTPLRPGESYLTTLVFDVPADAGATRLLLTEDFFVTRFLIGHENSLFHARTTLAVDAAPSAQTAGR